MSNDFLGDDDLILNTSTRVPICLCIDTSGSMRMKDGGDESRMARVQEGIRMFYNEIRENDMTRDSAEISIVCFSTDAYVAQDFKTIDNIDNSGVRLIPNGKGNLGLGVLKALDVLLKRKEQYKENGVEYYQPWIIIMTDGHPSGDGNFKEALAQAQRQVLELEDARKLTVIPVFIGREEEEGADLSEIDKTADTFLSGFSKINEPIQLVDSVKFSEFFTWLGKSVSTVAFADDVKLDFAALTNWDDI